MLSIVLNTIDSLTTTHRDSIVGIVKNNFHVCGQHSCARSLMQQGLTLFGSQMGEFIAEHELDGKEEITFAWTISTDDYIVPFIEWLNDRLLTITFESLNDNLQRWIKCVILGRKRKINRYYFGSKEASQHITSISINPLFIFIFSIFTWTHLLNMHFSFKFKTIQREYVWILTICRRPTDYTRIL